MPWPRVEPTDDTDSRLGPSTDVDGILQLHRRYGVRTNANINQGCFLGMQGTENLVHLSANAPSSISPRRSSRGLHPYNLMYFTSYSTEEARMRYFQPRNGPLDNLQPQIDPAS